MNYTILEEVVNGEPFVLAISHLGPVVGFDRGFLGRLTAD
jgi:hypothetical protein